LNEALSSVLSSLNLDGNGDINLDKFKRDFAAKCFKEYNPLRQQRKRCEMTIAQVSDIASLSKITVSNYESGFPQAAAPSLPNIFAMFEAVSPYSPLEDGHDEWLYACVGEYALWFRASTGDEEDMAAYVNTRATGAAETRSEDQ